MKTATELANAGRELANADWNLYDIKLLRIQIALSKRKGDDTRTARLQKKLDRLWNERYR